MRIAIVGAGAMGSLFGAQLARGGVDVSLVDVDEAHIQAIRTSGLHMRIGDEVKTVQIAATSEPDRVGPVDVVVMFCKFVHTAQAIREAQPMLTENTIVWTLQNGLGNVDLIADVVPRVLVAKGLTSMTARLEGPGRVSTDFRGMSETFMWPAEGEPTALHEEVARVFTSVDLPTRLEPDIDYRIWRKLAVNAGLTILSAAIDVGIGPVGESEAGQRLLQGITREVAAVAKAAGVPLEFQDAFGYVEELRRKAFDHVGSTTVDLQHGRPTEIDAMSGAVVREGEKLGVPTPINAVMTELIKLIEATRSSRLETRI